MAIGHDHKFVGALRELKNPKPYIMHALFIGIGIGFVTELLRKILKGNASYQQFTKNSGAGKTTDFILDAVVLPSPYASSFGGFVGLLTTIWFGIGGAISSLFDGIFKPRQTSAKPSEGEVPADMSTMSLVGGGLIGGDSLAALTIGIIGLLQKVLGH